MFLKFIELFLTGSENMNIVNSWFAMFKDKPKVIYPKVINIWPWSRFLFICLNVSMFNILGIYNSKYSNKDVI